MFIDAAKQTLASGGGTFTQEGRPVSHDTGYYVGGRCPSLVLPLAGLVAESLASALASYVARNGETFSTPGVFLGTWVDNDNVYVDASEWVENREDALLVGRWRNELAIWDCGQKAAVDTL